MLYNTQNYWGFWTFSIVLYSRKYKTRRFGNWICFRPQVRTMCFYFLEYRTMEETQKNPVILYISSCSIFIKLRLYIYVYIFACVV
jgi:hypothetical protein